MVWWNGEAFPVLTRFLYRSHVEVARHGYTAKQLNQTARKACHHHWHHELCSDMSSRPLLSVHFITELWYHDLVTSLFTVGKKKFRKIYKSYTSKFETLLQRTKNESDAKTRSWQLHLLLKYYFDTDHFQTPTLTQGKSISRITKNRSSVAPTALKKMWCRFLSKAERL